MVFWKKSEKDEWWRLPVYTIEIMENFEQLDFKRMAKRICLAQHSPSIFVENYRYTVLISQDVLFANNKIRACIATFKSSIPHYIGVFV